jgi:hypothetical protein
MAKGSGEGDGENISGVEAKPRLVANAPLIKRAKVAARCWPVTLDINPLQWQPVGWVELLRNPSLTSDVSMGFAALYPSYGLNNRKIAIFGRDSANTG